MKVHMIICGNYGLFLQNWWELVHNVSVKIKCWTTQLRQPRSCVTAPESVVGGARVLCHCTWVSGGRGYSATGRWNCKDWGIRLAGGMGSLFAPGYRVCDTEHTRQEVMLAQVSNISIHGHLILLLWASGSRVRGKRPICSFGWVVRRGRERVWGPAILLKGMSLVI